jgi:hypothetical protein
MSRLALFFLAAVLGAATSRASWLEFQPAYYTDYKIGTARAEGGASLAPPLSLYGFVDFYGQSKSKFLSKFDLNTYYGEVRLMQSLGFADARLKAWNLTVEANGGTDYDRILRFGVVWNTSLGKGNTFALKLYPAASRDHDAHASFYCAQTLTPELSVYAIFDYGFGTWIFGREQIYVELEARYRLNKQLSLFVQGRQFEAANGFKLDPSPVVGVKLSF